MVILIALPCAAHAGLASRFLKQIENAKQYFKQLYESRGGRLIVAPFKDEAESMTYGGFFTSISNQGPLRRRADIVLVFPRLVARLAVRKPGYTFTPIRGAGRSLVDVPTAKLSKALLQKAYKPSGLVKAIASGGSFYAVHQVILSHLEDLKQNSWREAMSKDLRINKSIYEDFVNKDYRAYGPIKQNYEYGLMSYSEALEAAWHYLELLEHYQKNLDKPLAVHEEVWQHMDNTLFQDVYKALHYKGLLNDQVYNEYFKAHGSVERAKIVLRAQLQEMVFNQMMVNRPAPKISKQQRDQKINDVFKAKHLLLHQDSFLDILFFDTKNESVFDLYKKPSFQEYALWDDFKNDPFVQLVMKEFERAQKLGVKDLSLYDLKFLLHQDFNNQYNIRVQQILDLKVDRSLEKLREHSLKVIYTKMGEALKK